MGRGRAPQRRLAPLGRRGLTAGLGRGLGRVDVHLGADRSVSEDPDGVAELADVHATVA